MSEVNIPIAEQTSSNNLEVPETGGRGFCQEIDEEFQQIIRRRRNMKHFNKKN